MAQDRRPRDVNEELTGAAPGEEARGSSALSIEDGGDVSRKVAPLSR